MSNVIFHCNERCRQRGAVCLCSVTKIEANEACDASYARGKADGMAEAKRGILELVTEARFDELAKVVAWLRTKVATQDCDIISRVIGEAAVQFADALERKEHRK